MNQVQRMEDDRRDPDRYFLHFRKEFTWGDAIALLVALCSLLVATVIVTRNLSTLEHRVDTNEQVSNAIIERLERVDRQHLDRVDGELDSIRERINRDEGRRTERHRQLLNRLDRIESRLNNLYGPREDQDAYLLKPFFRSAPYLSPRPPDGVDGPDQLYRLSRRPRVPGPIGAGAVLSGG